MAKASHVAADLDLDAVPLLTGALECTQRGVFSSLQPANLRLKRGIANEAEALSHPTYPLIFDPQTAGGLLASVPADQADACLKALFELGYPKVRPCTCSAMACVCAGRASRRVAEWCCWVAGCRFCLVCSRMRNSHACVCEYMRNSALSVRQLPACVCAFGIAVNGRWACEEGHFPNERWPMRYVRVAELRPV